jgi:hypothetical protein
LHELAVKPDGTVILITPCDEGLSSHTEEIRKSGYLPMQENHRRTEKGERFPDTLPAISWPSRRYEERGHLSVVTLPKNVSTFNQRRAFLVQRM